MNDANRAHKNRQYKTHINLNKSFKNIENNSVIEILLVMEWSSKKIARKNLVPWVGENLSEKS